MAPTSDSDPVPSDRVAGPGADVAVRAADRLLGAARSGLACPPVRDLIDPLDVQSAYRVQQELIRRRVAAGAHVAGRKIGLTSRAVQRQLGVERPDFGVLLDDMQFADDDVIPIERLIQPRAEAEIAFVLNRDIRAGDLTPAAVRAAVDHAVAAIEVVDSRIAGWDISLADTVADNASSGLFVLGGRPLDLSHFEPRDARMSMTINGRPASLGSGRDCLGDPLAALAWLARTVVEFGEPLRAGQVVLSGALGPMAPVGAGDVVRADISGLGTVTARFGGGRPA